MLDKVYPRLKEIFDGDDEVSPSASLVWRPFLHDVGIFYIMDCGDFYEYLTINDTKHANLTTDALHMVAIGNLERFAGDGRGGVVDVDEGVTMLTGMEGLETSLVLLPDKLKALGLRAVDDCLGLPARDVLLFADKADEDAVNRLCAAMRRVFDGLPSSQRVSPQLVVADPSSPCGYAHYDRAVDIQPEARTLFSRMKNFRLFTRH
jgi:hypothetical protein